MKGSHTWRSILIVETSPLSSIEDSGAELTNTLRHVMLLVEHDGLSARHTGSRAR